MRLIFSFVFCFLSALSGLAQVLPANRAVNWSLAGVRDSSTSGFEIIDMATAGAIGDSLTPNDSVISAVLDSLNPNGAVLQFPEGNFLFNHAIRLPSNVIIRGEGARQTHFIMDLGASGHAIIIQGSPVYSDTLSLRYSALKDSNEIVLNDSGLFQPGDWIQFIEQDSDLVTSSWAKNTVGQIIKIDAVEQNKIILDSPLRIDFEKSRSAFIRKIEPVKQVGLECISIRRLDDTAPQASSNIFFAYAVNCWVSGIESENCTYSHLQARYSSNIAIIKSYFHHAFSYGDGGRGYGVMLHDATGECLVENNIFYHLRHAMIVQAGANGNVFAYNCSIDPYWDILPNDAAGDIVLHGNYPFANLFEQNICRNIVVDNSHGANGPFNTFFRNRAEGFGIFFSANDSPFQNLIGNEITNTALPYSMVNYTIKGSGHFIYGNNNKGKIDPQGSNLLPDSSYYYSTRSAFIPLSEWAGIGTPHAPGSASIPALDRYTANNIFSNACANPATTINSISIASDDLLIYPNPVHSRLVIDSRLPVESVQLLNEQGQLIQTFFPASFPFEINTAHWQPGFYFVLIRCADYRLLLRSVVKIG